MIKHRNSYPPSGLAPSTSSSSITPSTRSTMDSPLCPYPKYPVKISYSQIIPLGQPPFLYFKPLSSNFSGFFAVVLVTDSPST